MSTEELRLEASVVDRFSAPLARLRNALSGVRPPGAVAASTRDFEKFQAAVSRSTQALSGGFGAALAGVGAPALGAAAGIAAVTASMSRFLSQATELRELNRTTGISVRNLQALQGAAAQFGSSMEAVSSGLSTFAQNRYDVARGVSSLTQDLLNADPSGKLLQQFSNPDSDKALSDSLATLGEMNKRGAQGAETARRLSQKMFGNDDFAKMTAEIDRFKRALAAAADRAPIISKEEFERAIAFDDAIGKLRNSMSALATTVGTELAPPMTKAIELIDKMVKESRGDIGKGLADGITAVGNALKAVDWELISKSISTTASATRDIALLFRMMEALSRGDMKSALDAFNATSGRIPADIKAARDEVEARKKTLAEFDKTNPGDARRRWHEENLRSSEEKLKKAIEEGARIGVKDGLEALFQKSSYGFGGGDGGGRIWAASYGGGGFGGRGGGVGRRAAAELGGAVHDALGGGASLDSATPGPGAGRSLTPNESAGRRFGGSRSWRNNNPGNIEYGPFARSMGSTGTDGRFAIFPDYDTGRRAQEKLLFESKSYRNLTLAQAIGRWAPASENNVPAYLRAMGGDPNTRMSSFTPEQRAKLLDAMQRHEGWRIGRIVGGNAEAGLPRGGYWAKDSRGNPVAVGPDGVALPGRRAVGAFNAAREAGTFGLSGPVARSGEARLAVTITADGKVKNSRVDGGDLFNRIDIDAGRTVSADQ